jgi:aconitate decarboxylase
VGLTLDAGRFVAGLSATAIPDEALSVAETGFCDCIAVMLASREDPAVIALTSVIAPSSVGTCSAVSTRRRLSATDAALLNGTAAHAQDFDDIGLGVHPAHPSAVMVPAILSLAEECGASGAEMLTAYVAGYEIWGECARREPGQHLEIGWHATGILGPLAAAAASANLLGLNAQQATMALSIAASQSAGLVANFGSMTKPLHAGLAARAGVLAAKLAAVGFSAGETSLEQPRGLLDAISPHSEADLTGISTFGLPWNITQFPLGIKLYPVCYALHRIVDCAVELHPQVAGRFADIARIDILVGTNQRKMLGFPRPINALEAKFSIEFGVATGLLEGALRLDHLDTEFLSQGRITELMEKVVITEDPVPDPIYRTFSRQDVVQVTLADGATFSHQSAYAKGHPTRPLSRTDLLAKFLACTGQALSADDGIALFEKLLRLRTLPDANFMTHLTASLSSSHSGASGLKRHLSSNPEKYNEIQIFPS